MCQDMLRGPEPASRTPPSAHRRHDKHVAAPARQGGFVGATFAAARLIGGLPPSAGGEPWRRWGPSPHRSICNISPSRRGRPPVRFAWMSSLLAPNSWSSRALDCTRPMPIACVRCTSQPSHPSKAPSSPCETSRRVALLVMPKPFYSWRIWRDGPFSCRPLARYHVHLSDMPLCAACRPRCRSSQGQLLASRRWQWR